MAANFWSAAEKLGGIYEARDSILGGFLSGLDEFAGALAFEFNKAFSSGARRGWLHLSDGDLSRR